MRSILSDAILHHVLNPGRFENLVNNLFVYLCHRLKKIICKAKNVRVYARRPLRRQSITPQLIFLYNIYIKSQIGGVVAWGMRWAEGQNGAFSSFPSYQYA
jgi:hypothetical protein